MNLDDITLLYGHNEADKTKTQRVIYNIANNMKKCLNI